MILNCIFQDGVSVLRQAEVKGEGHFRGTKKFNANNSNNAHDSSTKVTDSDPALSGADGSATELASRTESPNTPAEDAADVREAEPGNRCSPIILTSDDAFSKFWRSVTSQSLEGCCGGVAKTGQSRLSSYLQQNKKREEEGQTQAVTVTAV